MKISSVSNQRLRLAFIGGITPIQNHDWLAPFTCLLPKELGEEQTNSPELFIDREKRRCGTTRGPNYLLPNTHQRQHFAFLPNPPA